MGRWTQYDEDDHRLPEGMKRIGYDADSERYFFIDADGSYWRGEPGVQFGEMNRVSVLPQAISDADNDGVDLEASSQRRNGDYELLTDHESSEPQNRPIAYYARVNAASFRTLFPFFLIVAVVLLLVWRLFISPSLSTPTKLCPEGTSSHWIRPGETCWELSRERGWTLEKFKEENPKVVCEQLMPGTSVCLPPAQTPKRL